MIFLKQCDLKTYARVKYVVVSKIFRTVGAIYTAVVVAWSTGRW